MAEEFVQKSTPVTKEAQQVIMKAQLDNVVNFLDGKITYLDLYDNLGHESKRIVIDYKGD